MLSTLKSRLLLSALSVTGVAACCCAAPAHAATVINTPIPNSVICCWGPSINTSLGLFFTAPEPILVDYSLTVGTLADGADVPFVSQVYAWNGTATTGPALFTSAEDMTMPGLQTHTYAPDIRVTPGSEYIAFVTSPLGGAGYATMQTGTGPATLMQALGNPTLPDAWSATPGGANASFEAVFAVPEPSTWAMMLLGFAGLGFVSCRQTRRAKPQAA